MHQPISRFPVTKFFLDEASYRHNQNIMQTLGVTWEVQEGRNALPLFFYTEEKFLFWLLSQRRENEYFRSDYLGGENLHFTDT